VAPRARPNQLSGRRTVSCKAECRLEAAFGPDGILARISSICPSSRCVLGETTADQVVVGYIHLEPLEPDRCRADQRKPCQAGRSCPLRSASAAGVATERGQQWHARKIINSPGRGAARARLAAEKRSGDDSVVTLAQATRIERVADAVANGVDAQNRQEHERTRRQGQPRGGGERRL
jgi:hypothetical protein